MLRLLEKRISQLQSYTKNFNAEVESIAFNIEKYAIYPSCANNVIELKSHPRTQAARCIAECRVIPPEYMFDVIYFKKMNAYAPNLSFFDYFTFAGAENKKQIDLIVATGICSLAELIHETNDHVELTAMLAQLKKERSFFISLTTIKKRIFFNITLVDLENLHTFDHEAYVENVNNNPYLK